MSGWRVWVVDKCIGVTRECDLLDSLERLCVCPQQHNNIKNNGSIIDF